MLACPDLGRNRHYFRFCLRPQHLVTIRACAQVLLLRPHWRLILFRNDTESGCGPASFLHSPSLSWEELPSGFNYLCLLLTW